MIDEEPEPSATTERVIGVSRHFERVIVFILLFLMAVVVVLTTIELTWTIATDILNSPLKIEVRDVLDIFAFFLLVLIGLELLETIRAYVRTNQFHVEIVLEVALIAVARKAIVLDLEKYGAATLLSLAALIVALAFAYYLEQRAHRGGRL